MSGLNSPYMQAIRRPDDTHEGRPVFDVISRRQRIVLAKVFWYRPWKRFCWCANENGGNDIVWSDDCSDAIGAFCRELNVEFRPRTVEEAVRDVKPKLDRLVRGSHDGQ